MSRPWRLLVSLLLVVSLVAVPGVAAEPSPTAQSDGVERTFTTSLTPDEPGSIRVELRYGVPDRVTTLTTRLPDNASVQSTDGFERRSGTTYDWTRTTDSPTITYTLPVNETVRRTGGAGSPTTGYLYVDTGDWAITRAPRAAVSYSGTGPEPKLTTEYAFTGSGATSGDILYLGPFEEYRRQAAGQQFRLVVPAAADLRTQPGAILDSVAKAAETLSVGPRDPEVVAIAAPTTAGIEWGSIGLQRGESDFWVLDDRGVNTPANVWLHEYVHTQQTYRTASETEWTYEGMADYYAALLTYQQGRIDYDRYRRHLEAADDYDDVVLAEPETWRGTLANYDKGALVFAALDRRLRLETDGDGTLQDVLGRVNDGTVEQSAFLDAVDAVGGSDPRSFARRYTETDALPATWSRPEQQAAFGGPQFTYTLAPPYDRTGPYRTDAVDAAPSVVVGESLALRVAVENTGDEPGDYSTTFRVGGEPVAERTGSLAPGERTVLTVTRRFTEPGDRQLTAGSATETVTVREPATPQVTGLDAPERAAPGESIRLAATVENPADRPANGTVTLAVDGEPLATELVRLDTEGTATVAATTQLTAGEHTVTAGSRERTVTVPTATTRAAGTTAPETATAGEGSRSADGSPTPTGASGPGVGALGAVTALLLVGRLFVSG